MQIYYFSRTGRSQKIAEDLAAKNSAKALKIADNKNWNGAFGFIKACFASVRGKVIEAIYDKPADEGSIILVFPIWASTFPPAVKTFINEVGRERIIAVSTSLGNGLNDKEGFLKVYELTGKDISAPEEL